MCPPPASGKGGRPMTRTREISGSGQIFALLVLSQCFWLLCCRPSLVNGLLSMAASAVAYGVVFLLAVFCRRCAARGETPLSPVFAAWGAFLAVGYFAVTAEQLLSAARVLFEGVFSPLLLLLVLLGAGVIGFLSGAFRPKAQPVARLRIVGPPGLRISSGSQVFSKPPFQLQVKPGVYIFKYSAPGCR